MSDADDRRQLQDVMLSYAAAVDERDMARYRACFADDVEIVGFDATIVKGGDAWTASVERVVNLRKFEDLLENHRKSYDCLRRS